MIVKKWLVAGSSVVAILFVSDFLVHGILLKSAYEATASVWRPMPDMQSLMWMMWVLYVIEALVLPVMYVKGIETGKAPLGQGLRFGAMMGLLMSSGMSLGTYFMVPISASLAIAWFVTGMVQFLVVGAALALILTPAAEA